MTEPLATLSAETGLRRIDIQTGLFLERLGGGNSPLLRLAATLISRAVGQGHVCLPLEVIAADPLLEAHKKGLSVEELRRTLLAAPVVGRPGAMMPMILDHRDRLYLYRYFRHEEIIATALSARAEQILAVDTSQARNLLARLFPCRDGSKGPDQQQLAAALTLLKPLVVISGGPGTGKTYTVARILALLQALHDNRLRIGLTAPTGKAAARLQESIRGARLQIEPQLAAMVPEQTQTLHRLLGFHPGAGGFRHNRHNPLHLDLLVIDEASMVDVVLMSSLLKALPSHTRLILLGDRDQLASVEAGSLFSDLCGEQIPAWSHTVCTRLEQLTGYHLPAAGQPVAMNDCIVLLQTSYRFRDNSGIGQLAGAVNRGSMAEVAGVLKRSFPDLHFLPFQADSGRQSLQREILTGFGPIFTAESAARALDILDRFRVLCALRRGPAGVGDINTLAEQVLAPAGLLQSDIPWYRGRPIMILRNHYGLQLFNGDTGILWPDQAGRLQAWFRQPDGELRAVAPVRLPEHQTAWAITVHKSQGSEFERVLLLLPAEDALVLSRELLYTGITRARGQLVLYGNLPVLEKGLTRRAIRYSGLRTRLWPDREQPDNPDT